VEEYTGQPLLDAFSEFLLSHDPGFRWKPGRAVIRFEDFRTPAETLARESLRNHLPMRAPRDRHPLEAQ
jgi:hypothetical protein